MGITAKLEAARLSIRELNGAVPATLMTGDTLDISYLAEFGWVPVGLVSIA
jgi:hypothetical protein